MHCDTAAEASIISKSHFGESTVKTKKISILYVIMTLLLLHGNYVSHTHTIALHICEMLNITIGTLILSSTGYKRTPKPCPLVRVYLRPRARAFSYNASN